MVRITPARESVDGAGAGGAGMAVADIGGEELDQAPSGIVAMVKEIEVSAAHRVAAQRVPEASPTLPQRRLW